MNTLTRTVPLQVNTGRTTIPLVGHGLAIGLDTLEGFVFDPHSPYSGCRICGELFQTDLDRQRIKTALQELTALQARQAWSHDHSRLHPEHVHKSLALSGRYCTPEAAHRLAAFGVISIIDLALDDEVSHALRESKPVPQDDVEGS